MHRTDGDQHVSNMFSDGDPGVPRLGTEVEEAWLNAVQEELINILTSASVTPVKGTNTQVLQALSKIMVPRTPRDDADSVDYFTTAGRQRVIHRRIASGSDGTSELWITVNARWNGSAWAKDVQAMPALSLFLGTAYGNSGPSYAGTIVFGKQTATVATFADSDWAAPITQASLGLTSPWADSGGSNSVAKVWVDPIRDVRLQGTVSHGGGGGGPTVDAIATLSAAYRPATDLRFTTSYLDTTYKHCTILITSAGVITSDAAVGSQVRLDGIRFPVGV